MGSVYEAFIYLKKGKNTPDQAYKEKFLSAIGDDLNTPKAVALLHELVNDENVESSTKRATVLYFDKVLGLGFAKLQKVKIPKNIEKLVNERERARLDKDWQKSDKLRKEIEDLGYLVRDEKGQTKIVPAKISPND